MAGLEIPAFVIGLTAVITVADKCLSICRVISAAKHYGADVVERLAEFEIEHYRFSLFVRYVKPVLETRAVKSSRSSVPDQEGIKDPIGLLVDRVKNTLQQICDLLKDREVIAIAPGTGAPVEQILTVAGRHQASVPTTSADAILTGSSEVPVSERTSRLATELQKQSFKSRMGFYSTKWRENDNDAWRKLNDRLSGWVDRLYDFLPSTIRDVLAHEALLGLVLEDGGDIAASKLSEMATASKGRYSFLDQAYQLRAALDGFAKNPLQIPGVSMKISMRNVQPDPDQQGLRLWAGTYAPRGVMQPTRVVVEWFDVKIKTAEDHNIASARMHQLAVLCHGENELKRSTLRTLDCVGYTEGVGGRFGFVWQFNSGADATKAPQSLNTLLQAGQNFPTLPQRLKLAQSLANAILIFHGVGWLHKNFNSHSVYFFQLEKDPGGYRSRIMYEEPAIGGFDVARLHQEGEVSLRMGIDYYKLYTAPELQQKDERRFERVFDVYSLGLILFEIGTWTLVSKYAGVGKNKPPLTPQQFKERILQRCLTDLPLEMGAKYADVTVRCLNGDYPKASLDGFYMAIVQVLAECQCQGC